MSEIINSPMSVASQRGYRVINTSQAKDISTNWLVNLKLENVIKFGLPEVDDRYHIWRVPLKNLFGDVIGEVVIDAYTSFIDTPRTSDKSLLEARLLGRSSDKKSSTKIRNEVPKISSLRDTVGLGDSEELLKDTSNESVDLVFTSPPYYNARLEYAEYGDYDDYLQKMRKVIRQCHRVLNEGRFFIINISPVLLRRSSRSESSKRLAVPFDFHRIFMEEGFDFIDDIIWQKPEGAGWATGRGRRFAADRNPLQYKPVPVTEYLLVYRKKTDKLIDWHIRKHPDQAIIEKSKITGEYDVTNIWKISPSYSKKHPAIFPLALAERVIKYYSFINDVVLDPFAGIGTTGKAAAILDRRFILYEREENFIKTITEEVDQWLIGKKRKPLFINCEPNKQILTLKDKSLHVSVDKNDPS